MGKVEHVMNTLLFLITFLSTPFSYCYETSTFSLPRRFYRSNITEKNE